MTGYTLPADIGLVVGDPDDEGGAVIYLAPLPDGPMLVLNGVASLIWLEATATDEASDVVDRVAVLVDRPRQTIRSDVKAFVDQLVERGLLEPTGD